MERIISNEARTDWYDQDQAEFVVLLEGTATLQFEDTTLSLEKGDWVFIEEHEKHRVLSTSDNAIWLCFFL